MKGTFGTLDPRLTERMRLALIETLCTHFASPPFFDPRAGTERVRPLDKASLDAIAHFIHSVNYSPLDTLDVSSNEVRRFLEGVLLRYLAVNPAFKQARYARYMPALRARAPRLAADVHRALLAALSGKAANFGAPPRKRSWTEGRERARKIPAEVYERSTRILEAAMIRSRIDDYTDTGFVPQVAPADVARRPPAPPMPPAPPSQDTGQWLNTTANDLTVPVSATGFATAFSALGSAPPTNIPPDKPQHKPQPMPQPMPQPAPQRMVSDQPTSPFLAVSTPPKNGAAPPRELPDDLYELYGDYLQDMQPDTTITPSLPARPGPVNPPPWQSGPAAPPWQSAPVASPPSPPIAPPSGNGRAAHTANHADHMVFWQLRYQLEAYVRRAAESYGLSYKGSDPSMVLDTLRQSGFVDEADLRIAEGILALTDRVTKSTSIAIEDYRQAFLLYLLYHRSHLGI